MKKSRLIIIGILLFNTSHLFSSPPDEWSGRKESILLDNWSVNINFGFTSYFGDLSQYDVDVINKLGYESKTAYGIKLTKYVRNVFCISGQMFYGGFNSDYRPEHSFETKLIEYSLQAGLEVVGLIIPKRSMDFGLELYVGTGQFVFRTSINTYRDGQQLSSTSSTGVPEFIYFFGSEFFVNISNRIKITTNLSIRQAQNDNIDKYLNNGDFDYYSLLNFGITYSFGKVFIPVNDKPNIEVNKSEPIWRNNR